MSLARVFRGADGALIGVDTATGRFTASGVTTAFFPTTEGLGAGERCLLSVPGRWTGRMLGVLAAELRLGLEAKLEAIFGPTSTGFVFNFDGTGALTSGICINDKQILYWHTSPAVNMSTT